VAGRRWRRLAGRRRGRLAGRRRGRLIGGRRGRLASRGRGRLAGRRRGRLIGGSRCARWWIRHRGIGRRRVRRRGLRSCRIRSRGIGWWGIRRWGIRRLCPGSGLARRVGGCLGHLGSLLVGPCSFDLCWDGAGSRPRRCDQVADAAAVVWCNPSKTPAIASLFRRPGLGNPAMMIVASPERRLRASSTAPVRACRPLPRPSRRVPAIRQTAVP
jgi:hypothetical protein